MSTADGCDSSAAHRRRRDSGALTWRKSGPRRRRCESLHLGRGLRTNHTISTLSLLKERGSATSMQNTTLSRDTSCPQLGSIPVQSVFFQLLSQLHVHVRQQVLGHQPPYPCLHHWPLSQEPQRTKRKRSKTQCRQLSSRSFNKTEDTGAKCGRGGCRPPLLKPATVVTAAVVPAAAVSAAVVVVPAADAAVVVVAAAVVPGAVVPTATLP